MKKGIILILFASVLVDSTHVSLNDERSLTNVVETKYDPRVFNWITKDDAGVHLRHPRYSADFTESGINFKPASDALPYWTWKNKSQKTQPTHLNGIISYNRGSIIEQYVLKENSIEQRFILTEALSESLVIAGDIESNGEFIDKDNGQWLWKNEIGQVSLSDVYAFDANGTPIKAVMHVSATKSEIEISTDDLIGAAYPVTIDPEIGTNDFRISNFGVAGDISATATKPSVAYNSYTGRYLVVWQTTGAGETEVMGQLINEADWTPIGSPIQIYDALDPSHTATDPDVASGITRFLVVWRGDHDVDGEFDIYGQYIDAATGALPTTVTRISHMGPDGNTNYDAANPAVVFNSNTIKAGAKKEFAVVWSGDNNLPVPLADGEYEIWGQRLDSAGNRQSLNDFRISNMGADGVTNFTARQPDIAWNSADNSYGVVWFGDDAVGAFVDNESEVFFQLISSTGGQTPTTVDTRISSMGPVGSTLYAAGRPRIAYNSGAANNFLAVWHADNTTDNENEIWGQLITNLGVETGTADFRISNMGTDGNPNFNATLPNVQYDTHFDQFLVTWQGDQTGTTVDDEFEIYGQLIQSGVESGVDFRLTNMGGLGNTTYAAANANLVYAPKAREYFIVWDGDNTPTNDEFEIWGQIYANADPEPTLQPTSPPSTGLFTNVTPNSLTVSYVAAGGAIAPEGYLTMRKGGSSLTESPGDNTEYSVGTSIGGATVRNASSVLTFNESGLSPETQYTYSIFSSKGVKSSLNYKTTSALSETRFTLSPEPTVHASTFAAATGGTAQINLSFSTPTEDGYILLRRTGATSPTATGILDGAAAPSTPTAGTTLVTTTSAVATTYPDVALSPGTQYSYALIPYGYNGTDAQTYNFRTAATIPTANAFTLSLEPIAHSATFTATQAGTNQINLGFSAASTITNASGYVILRRQDGANPTATGINDGIVATATPPSGTTVVTTITNTSATSFNDTGLSPGMQYNYAIVPYGHNGVNDQTYNFRTAATIPTANAFTLSPEPIAHAASLTAVQASSTQIDLSFSAASTITNATGYIILRRLDGSNPTASGINDGAVASATLPSGTTLVTTITNTAATTYSDAGLSSTVQYNYAIIPFGYNGTNAPTYNFRTAATIPTANATTPSLEPLTHAASFTSAQSGTNQINLTFSAASTITNAAGYIILRRQDSANPTASGINDGAVASATLPSGTTLVTTITSLATTTYNDAGLAAGTQYNYAIIPYGYNGSNALTYNFKTAATIPTTNFATLSVEPSAHASAFTAAQAGPSQVNLSFSAASTIANAVGYIILRTPGGTSPAITGVNDGAAANPSGSTLVTTITNTATTTYNDLAGLSPGTQYSYSIIPFGYNGSNVQTYNFRIAATIPSASTFTLSLEPVAHSASFTATQISTSQINLAFSAASTITNAAGYIILRRQDGSNPTATGINDAAAASATLPVGTTLVTTITNTSTNAFNDTGLVPGTQYNYAIIPYGYNGINAATYNFRTAATIPVANSATLSPEPGAYPTFKARQVGSNQLKVSFAAANTISNATGYILLRRADGSDPTTTGINDGATAPPTPGGSTLITTITNAADTAYLDAGVSPTVQYNYAIIPFGYNGSNALTYNFKTSPAIPTAHATALDIEPTTQPSDLLISNPNATSLDYTFPAAVGSPTGYIVLRKIGSAPGDVPKDAITYAAGDAIGTSTVAYVGPAPASPITDSNLSANTVYYYAVFAFKGISTLTMNYLTSSPLVGSRTTLKDEPLFSATGLTFSAITSNSMKLSFPAATGSPEGYIVLRREAAALTEIPIDGTAYAVGNTIGSGTVIYVGAAPASPFPSSSLFSGKVYHYAVFSYNGSSDATNYRTSLPLIDSQVTTVVEPTSQPKNISFGTVTPTSMQVSFQAALDNLVGYLVLINTTSTTDAPVDGQQYVLGQTVGTSTVAYNGGQTQFTSTGLSPATVYFYSVFSYNGDVNTYNYLTTQVLPLTGSQTTLSLEPGTQPKDAQFTAQPPTTYAVGFTANGSPTGYLVLRRTDAASTGVPQDGTPYSVGNTIGDGTVVARGPALTFAQTDPSSVSAYYYTIFAFNGTGANTNYLAIDPLPMVIPATPQASADADLRTRESFQAAWSASPGATSYELDASVDDFATMLPGFNAKKLTNALNDIVNGLSPKVIYKFRVRSVNAYGKSLSSVAVAVETKASDGTTAGLKINTTASVSTLADGTANVTLSANVTGGSSAITVKLYYRPIMGEAYFDAPAVGSGDNFSVILQASKLDDLGLEYYFKATAGAETDVQATHSFIYRSINTAAAPTLQNPTGGTAAENYRIISIPYQLEDNLIQSLFEPLGEYNVDWRLLQYKGGKNVDYPGINRILQGNGYWFISLDTAKIKLGRGSVPQNHDGAPFKINLVKGWNQIGAPYPFNVDWDDVQKENIGKTVGDLNVFVPKSATLEKSNSLKAWSGGFVFCDTDITDFSFPVSLKNTATGRTSQPKVIESSALDGSEWLVDISLRQGDVENSNIGFGMHPQASADKDKFDGIAVPRFFNYLEMATDHPEFFAPLFARDVVPAQQSYNWKFTVASNLAESDASLRWSPESFGNNDAKLILYDEQAQTFVDMRTTSSYSFAMGSDRTFHIIYAASEKEWNPGFTLLSRPWPNPTAGQTTVPVILQESRHVTVEVHDLNGKTAKTLVNDVLSAGVHELVWTGEGNDGQRIAPGMYLVLMRSGTSARQVQKLIVK